MCGYVLTRFVDLKSIVYFNNTFVCNICHNVLNKAVTTSCRHSFCSDCLRKWLVVDQRKDCPLPECGKQILGRKRASDSLLATNGLNINGQIVAYNETLNEMIGVLNIKCAFVWNGCETEVMVDQLADHEKTCGHRDCQTCLQPIVGQIRDQHNCEELLREKESEWRTELVKVVNTRAQFAADIKTIKAKIAGLEANINDIKAKDKEFETQNQVCDEKLQNYRQLLRKLGNN